MNSLCSISIAFFVAASAFSLSATARAQEDAYDDTDPNALVDFHATLDPYGRWLDDPTYGTVWTPSAALVGPDFTPYATGGHWAYGDDYTWVSDYDWGWAPFHYGRWVYADGRGWAWIAGRQYAPAWVQWRVGEPGVSYVGWAPAPPSYVWRGGVPMDIGVPVPPRFVFCPTSAVFHPRVFERIVRGPEVDAVAIRTRPFEENPWGGGRRFGGPPPSRIGLEPARIVRVSGYEPGIARARDFGRPTVAVLYGAHPPIHVAGPAFRPLERSGGRPEDRPRELPSGRPLQRPVERPIGPDPERVGDRPFGRPAERAGERPVDRRSEPPHGATPPQGPARIEPRAGAPQEQRPPTPPRATPPRAEAPRRGR